MALYSNIAKGKIPVGDAAYSATTISALLDIRNSIWNAVLPSGRLKDLLMSTDGSLPSLLSFYKSLFSGRVYRQGHYTLGERLIDQIQCTANVGWKDVPDDIVPIARLVFTMLFGVRISTIEDLDALQSGYDAYWARNPDQPQEAIDRAVMLKQTYFPDSTYNKQCWDVSIFDNYPLVAPVPEMNADMFSNAGNVGRYYTGPGFNGVNFVDGYPTPDSTTTGLISEIQPGGSTDTGTVVSNTTDNAISYLKSNPLIAAIGVAIVGYLICEYE